MKKWLFLFLICLFFLPSAWGFQIKDRFFEIGFNAGFSFSNDFLSANEVFREKFVLDLDKLGDGFKMNLGVGVTPLYFNYNSIKGWGFGLSTNAEAMGIFNLSGEMLTFGETGSGKDGNSEISGAVFAETAVPGYFTYKKFKIKFKPALYFPILYATSDIKYTYTNSGGGTVLNIGYDLNVYTIVSMNDNSNSGLTSTPGVDFYAGVEYPLSQELGLKEIFFLLDFDVGLDITGIPIVPSSMKDYMKMSGNIGSNEPIKLFGEEANVNSFVNFKDAEYKSEKKTVLRPFKLLAHVDWRPLGIQLLTVTPSLGFAISPMYNKSFSMEAGVKARVDLFNALIFTAGIGYHDRLWKNGFDLALNCRMVEFNFGAALCSPSFTKSWNGSGFSINTGFKFGW